MNLQCVVCGGHLPGPRLLITAGVHGDEFEPMAAVQSLADELRDKNDKIRGSVTLIPIVNQSAYLLGSRTAEDELDLARTCPGDSEGSVTQRIAAALSEVIRAADYYIDLHTGGSRLRLTPLTGYMLHADPMVLAKQREMAVAFDLPIIWGTSAELEGRSISVARDAGIPAIYAEHGGGGSFDRTVVEDYRRGCMQVMGHLGMIDSPPVSSSVTYQIEDGRSGSGHLQVCHPAPRNGLFVPRVQVGQMIRQGEVLGEFLDLANRDNSPIVAEQGGLVLMLHTAPHVRQGTGLAVVLELDQRQSQLP